MKVQIKCDRCGRTHGPYDIDVGDSYVRTVSFNLPGDWIVVSRHEGKDADPLPRLALCAECSAIVNKSLEPAQ